MTKFNYADLYTVTDGDDEQGGYWVSWLNQCQWAPDLAAVEAMLAVNQAERVYAMRPRRAHVPVAELRRVER